MNNFTTPIKKIYKKNFLLEKQDKEIINDYLITKNKFITINNIIGKKESKWRGRSNINKYIMNHETFNFKEIEKRFNSEMGIKKKCNINKKYFESFINLLSRKTKNYFEKRKKIEELKNNNLSERNLQKGSQFYLTSGDEYKKNFEKNKINLNPNIKNRIFQKLKNAKFYYENYPDIKFNNTTYNNKKKYGDEIELKEPFKIEGNKNDELNKIKFDFKHYFPKLNSRQTTINYSKDNSNFQPLSDRVYNPYQKEFLRNVFYRKNKEIENEKKLFQKKLMKFP
jgi:hypothetical protein